MTRLIKTSGWILLIIFSLERSAAAAPRLAIEGGVSLSNLAAPTGITASNITGFVGGIGIELPVGESLSFMQEILYVQRGASLANGGGTVVSARYSTIELPGLIRLKFLKEIQPVLFAGPTLSFNISEGVTTTSGGGTISFNPSLFDLALAVGAGVDVGPFLLNVRYLFGILNIDESGASWQSRGLLALAGFRF